ncbi:helix-turn-helix domain-containing protein [Pseudomonas sp. GD03842]|uniref:transcriptional regulator n=1 Tax=Pseudomonas sp. GD03842 TaxID=2975385 RepID=UPI0024471D96|nr:YdaS family helix-turn-helix protein [Pseudomonas sp. GD03842]MDH0745764.1 helix-turn-helix domain-containing protein [Pseudomonas sp. GD03842]
MSTSPMASAVKIVGSQTALAKILGCTPQNVQRMCATGRIPAKHVLKIEAASGIHRSVLSPEIYPDPAPTMNQMVGVERLSKKTADAPVQASSAGGAQ